MHPRKLYGIYYGVIDDVYPPGDPLNRGKYQYEYRVVITAGLYAQIPVKAVCSDLNFGNFNGYHDQILEKGYRVFVQFPNDGDITCGIITAGARSHPFPQIDEGVYFRKRFGPIQNFVNADGMWGVHVRELANGPATSHIYVDKDGVRLGDNFAAGESAEDYIKLDQASGEITIKSNKSLKINVLQGDAVIQVGGKVSLTCVDLEASVSNGAKITALKLEASITTEAKIEVLGVADIKAQVIKLNGELGGVLTTASQPTCYVTGIPFNGSQTVKAGL